MSTNTQFVELVYGEQFVSVQPTPYLAAVIKGAADAIRAAVGPGSTVVVDAETSFGPSTVLRPDVAARLPGVHETATPDLVIEVRTESTDRYALGPKRLVYSRHRVPQYLFVDPVARVVRQLRAEPGVPDYPWPPSDFGADDTIALLAFRGATVAVRDLLGP